MSAQTADGVQRWKDTMAKKYGSYEKYKAQARLNGAKGGRNGKTDGWAHGKISPADSLKRRKDR